MAKKKIVKVDRADLEKLLYAYISAAMVAGIHYDRLDQSLMSRIRIALGEEE